jgi:hypothetical protein
VPVCVEGPTMHQVSQGWQWMASDMVVKLLCLIEAASPARCR